MPEDPYVEAILQALPSPDYVPSPEEPEQAPPSPDYVPGPEHADDEISDPKADPEEDDDEDPEEDPVDYLADGGDNGDDEDEPLEEDEDDDVDIEADEDEEEEHPAPADSVVVALPVTDQAPSAEETEPFETDESAATPPPHPAYRVIARISIPAPVPTLVWSDAEVSRHLAISTLPSSSLSPWSSPVPHIPSPPLPSIPSPSLPISPSLPVSPPLPLSSPVPVLSSSPPASPIRSLGYQVAMIRLRAEAASTSHLLPLPPPFILSHTRPAAPSPGIPTLHLLSTDRREDRPEVTLPPRKRLGIVLGPRYKVGESSSAATARPSGGLRADYGFVATMDREIRHDPKREVGYGITDSWNEIVETLQGAPVSTDTELDHKRSADMRELRTTDRTQQQQLRTLTVMQSLQGQLTTLQGQKMAPKRATRLTPVTTTPAPTATTTTLVTNTQIQAMIDQGVTAALAARDANRNGDDNHTSGTGGRRTERVARECTYQDFMKCKPLYIKGTKGVVELTQWFERMETVFRISNCFVENQIKFSTCTLLAGALPWWNSHVITISHDIAYAMTWADLRKKMTDKYCPRNEMKKLKAEMFPEEFDKIERLRTKGSLKTLPETIKTNNNRTRGRTLAGLILQGLVKRSHTGDLKPYALNATITTTVQVLQNATNLAILPVNVGVREMLTMLTIRGALGQARNLLALSVEFKDTSRAKTVEIKLVMTGLQPKCMRWDMQGQTQTPTS
ncbi:hypothetical protein Tco_0024903 [Tanacetum coccineum]